MQHKSKRRVLLEVETYDGNEVITHAPMTRQELTRQLDLKGFNACMAKCLGVSGYRDPRSEGWVEFTDNGKHLGPKLTKLLTALQLNPGVFHDATMLYELTGEEALLDPGNSAAYVHRIRTAFGESKKNEHFILTKRGLVTWNAESTWISVMPFLRKVEEHD